MAMPPREESLEDNHSLQRNLGDVAGHHRISSYYRKHRKAAKCRKAPEGIQLVIYLRIARPTSGRGVQVFFRGYEEFIYEYKEGQDGGRFLGYREHKDYIKYDDGVVLYESQDPLTIGNTLYPFKIHLPSELPGTFHATGDDEEVRWQATVDYRLEVQVIGSPALKVCRTMLVLQVMHGRDSSCSEPQAVHVVLPIRFLLVIKRNLHIMARLRSHEHRTGGSAELRLILTNHSRVKVQSLKIRLVRNIVLMRKKPCLPVSQSDRRVRQSDGCVYLCVETNKLVGIEQNLDMDKVQNCLDRLQIPLRNVDGTNICPSVRGPGHHITCEYKVYLEVTMANNTCCSLEVPVSAVVAAKPNEYDDWEAPEWVTTEDVHVEHSSSIFGVSENELCGPSFSKMPGFQPL